MNSATVRLKVIRSLEEQSISVHLSDQNLHDHPELKRAIFEADKNFEQVVALATEAYYQLVLSPATITLGSHDAGALIRMLGLKISFPHTHEPRVVRYDNSLYKISVDSAFCG
ncbi:MAG: hypothetical protein HYU02_01385 [Thaumarchaeota archaeon]|nr:hypothetical protein [Nitrososphaerota archaeon]